MELAFVCMGEKSISAESIEYVPLMCLTHKGTIWHFSNECHSAFKALKKAFTTALVLTHWMLDTQITVKTDASDYVLTAAAVLSITTMNGKLHPIAFHS